MADLPTEIQVDFNNLGEDGLVFARLSRASRPLQDGDPVIASDDEGNTCAATVARLEGELVFLELDMTTWISGPIRTTAAVSATGRYMVVDTVVVAEPGESATDESRSDDRVVVG